MAGNSIGSGNFSEKILNTLREIKAEAQDLNQGATGQKSGMSFTDHLKQGIEEVNAKSVTSDKMNVELATGRNGNIHDAMLAATQAELSFNLMVQLRNKALEAYSEIMRMPV
jgi:flagellar hook-basal body complex protein FliE